MLLKAKRFQFSHQYPSQDQNGAQYGPGWQPFAQHGIREAPGHHWLQRKNQRRAGGRGHLLRPGLHRKRQSRREQRRNQQRHPQKRAGMKKRFFQPPETTYPQRRRGSKLPDRQRLERRCLGIMPQNDNVGGKRHRAQNYHYIAPGHTAYITLQSHQSHSDGGDHHADGLGNMWIHPIDERIEQRYHDDGQAGEEGDFRRRRRVQSHGLKRIAGEQADSGQDAASGRTGCKAPAAAEHPGQHQRRHQEADGDIEDGRRVVQGALDHHERRAPDQGIAYQRQVGRKRISDVGFRISGGLGGVHRFSRSNSSSVNTMRFRARSRPSGRNHSLGVWALPPVPPAPIETAGISRESGILASVEAQSRCDRMPRWASTARKYVRMDAPSASRPAGREPISFSLTATFPPVARSFSTLWARSTADARISTRPSIFSLLSERISTLALASVGIELMLAPPSIMPILKAARGGPFNLVSANSETARLRACTGFPVP